ncbi:hypothetical protein Trco_003384 [Trichoderma cornu-damae]|uniref:Uncharacterized protein n=1 Tax=Trichoderma cornu-damae TaxID=654480 RepID=A0A9P8TT81_9HYPO|nr:hypothetical protein Trco_003384 [Trichoderma cornu-damae]
MPFTVLAMLPTFNEQVQSPGDSLARRPMKLTRTCSDASFTTRLAKATETPVFELEGSTCP